MVQIILKMYFDCGGLGYVFRTPYIYLAALLTLLLADPSRDADWASLTIGMFPSILGFSLATFAIVLAILGENRVAKLSISRNSRPSSLARLTALIVHTALIQAIALLIAFSLKQGGACRLRFNEELSAQIQNICEQMNLSGVIYYSGLFLTIYGLFLLISTLLAVYQTALLVK